MVTGSGSFASVGFARCIKSSTEDFFLVGIDCDEKNVTFIETDEKVLVPRATEQFDLQRKSNYILSCQTNLDFI